MRAQELLSILHIVDNEKIEEAFWETVSIENYWDELNEVAF
jgi:hypothetical protein